MRRPRRRSPRRHTHPGIAVASACASCAPLIGSPPEHAPGWCMAIVHDHDVPRLVAAGWVLTRNGYEPPDIACQHYFAAHWQD